MRNVLALCSLLLVSLAAVASTTPVEPIPDDPLFVQALSSAPTASVANAKSHFDGRIAPAAAVSTKQSSAANCGHSAGQVRFMHRGPVRRAIGWLFRGRHRC